MLRRAASLLGGRAASLLGGRAAWLRRLPRRPVTTAATLLPRHPEARPRSPAPLPPLGDVGARGYARMARRIPPARPDGYSTSDGEADACGDEEDLEPGGGEEGAVEGKEWEGFMLDFGSGTDDEGEEGDATEEKGK